MWPLMVFLTFILYSVGNLKLTCTFFNSVSGIIGDTANKIGTYSLALCAKHHNIPFLVAAPLTSIDLSITSGEEIVIEERSPKEVLHARGGLGEQVAAPGIAVWNPAFDVTPADIISGIITEKVTLSLIHMHRHTHIHNACVHIQDQRTMYCYWQKSKMRLYCFLWLLKLKKL